MYRKATVRIFGVISVALQKYPLTLWRARQLCFFYVQILPELKNIFLVKEVDRICWGIIKLKILYKISGMKFSSLQLKLSGFAVKPPPMKGLKRSIRCMCIHSKIAET